MTTDQTPRIRQRTYARKGLLALWADGTARPVMFFVKSDSDPFTFLPVVHDEVFHRVIVISQTAKDFLGVFTEDEAKQYEADALLRKALV
jgi:hypothetical protein